MTTVNNNDTPPLPLGMNSTKISPPAKQDLAAMVLLIALAAWFFRNHLSGVMTFFGNPDRLNNHLKVLKHHIDSLAIGHLSAWSDTELLGYDTFSLPYTFPNPLTYLTYWFGPDNIFVTAGFISAALLALAGIGAYAALRLCVRPRGSNRRRRITAEVYAYATSNSPAAPMPPAMHMVATTCLTPRRRPSISACPTSRLPVMP